MRPVSPFTLVLAAALLLGMPSGVRAQSAIPPEEMADRLATAASFADAGVDAPSRGRMDEIRDALGLPVALTLQGSETTIGPDPVLEGLVGDDQEDFRRAAERVGALRASLERAIAADVIDPGEVDAALSSAYRGSLQVGPGLVERIRRAAVELIQNLLSRLFSFRGAGTLVAWAVLAGLGALAFWLLRRLQLVPETTMEAVRGGPTGVRVDWISRAEGAVRAGDLHAAVHAFYRALLGALSGGGLLIDTPGLTAGEARSTVREVRPDLFRAVADATGTFERVAYGGAAPGPDEVETLRKAVALARSS